MVFEIVDSLFSIAVLLGFVAVLTYGVIRVYMRFDAALTRYQERAVVRQANRVLAMTSQRQST